nr:hypothetical protein [Tanacetum cinerariifolium]
MDKSESYLAAPKLRERYEGLIKSDELDKTLFSTYDKVYSLKGSQKDKAKDEDPFAGLDRGLKKRKASKDAEPKKRKSFQSEEPKFEVADSDMPQDQVENPNEEKTLQQGPTQSWLMTHTSSTDKPSKTFDELMSTPKDFSTYIINGLKITNLTQETLLGPAFRLLKDIRTNYAKLKYDYEDCYKALSEKLDWENPEGGDYPFDLTKSLPLVMNRNRQMIEVIRKHGYGYLKEIRVQRSNNVIYKFKEGYFLRLRINDIEDMLLLVVQNSGPYKPTTVLVQAVEATGNSPAVPEHTTVETPTNMSPENKANFLAEKEAIHLILTRIGDDIYLTVDACQMAQEIWEAIERPNGEALRKCILNGPYKPTTVFVQVVDATDDYPAVPEHTIVETPMNMSPENKAHFLAEKEGIHLILTGIGDDIYSTVDACQIAQEMWEAIARLQQGESLNIQDVKTNLFWEFGKFTSHDGESMESYYTRFYKLMNEMIRNNLTVPTMQVNIQFLQRLQPEWSRFVTIVKQQHKLDEVSYHKLFDILKQYQNEVNVLRAEKLSRNANPLALVATAQANRDQYYQTSRTFRNQRTVNVAASRENVGSKPKRVKDSLYHKEKMLLCKQAEQGVPLQAEQYDWLADTDEEVDEQELEAHYSYMAKIQEVPTADSGTDTELVE